MDIHDLPRKLSKRIQINDETGCWLWQGGHSSGYGQVYWTADDHRQFGGPDHPGGGYRRSYRVHRLVWILLKGPLDPSLVLDHTCNVRACANPEHLEEVTIAENSKRAGGSRRKSQYCGKGHLLSGNNLYVAPRDGRWKCRACEAAGSRRRRAGRIARGRWARSMPGQSTLL